jgi:hypothetical protein
MTGYSVPQMNGVRHHYMNMPGIASNDMYNMPDIMTSHNLGSSKDDVTYKKSSDEEETLKPTKSLPVEDKRNLTKLMNVMSSKDHVPRREVTPAKEDNTSISKNVMDLLVSDMTDLNINKKESSLYPTIPKEKIQKHQKLLRQLSVWVNTSSVQVQ